MAKKIKKLTGLEPLDTIAVVGIELVTVKKRNSDEDCRGKCYFARRIFCDFNLYKPKTKKRVCSKAIRGTEDVYYEKTPWYKHM